MWKLLTFFGYLPFVGIPNPPSLVENWPVHANSDKKNDLDLPEAAWAAHNGTANIEIMETVQSCFVTPTLVCSQFSECNGDVKYVSQNTGKGLNPPPPPGPHKPLPPPPLPHTHTHTPAKKVAQLWGGGGLAERHSAPPPVTKARFLVADPWPGAQAQGQQAHEGQAEAGGGAGEAPAAVQLAAGHLRHRLPCDGEHVPCLDVFGCVALFWRAGACAKCVVSGVWCLSAWNRFHRTHRIRLPRPGWAGRRHTAAGEASIASLSSPPRSPPPPPVPRVPAAFRRAPHGADRRGGVCCLPPAHALHSAGTLAGMGR